MQTIIASLIILKPVSFMNSSKHFLLSSIKRILPFVFAICVNFSSFSQSSCFKGDLTICNESIATYVAGDVGTGSIYNWTIIGNTSGGSIVGKPNGGSVSIHAGHQGYIDLELFGKNGNSSYSCVSRINV